jgi:HK97 family phage portal protein
MALFDRLFNRTTEERAISSSNFNLGIFEGKNTSAGINVDSDVALSLTGVYSAVNILANAVASLPVHAYRKTNDYRQLLDQQPTWIDKVSGMVNPECDQFEFFHRIMTSLLLHGNAYIVITNRDRQGYPSELYNVHPDDVTIQRNNGAVLYTVINQGKDEKPLKRYTSKNPTGSIVHIKAFADGDDLKGISPIQNCKEAIGFGKAVELFGSRFFENGTTLSGVIEIDQTPTEEQLRQFMETWDKHHRGVEKSHRPGILTGGAKWRNTSLPPDQAQFIDSRRFSIEEIARIFNVPLFLLNEHTKQTSWGSGLEEQNKAFIQYSVTPWLTRIEITLNQLLPRGQFVKFDLNGYLRGNAKDRVEVYNKLRMLGVLTANDIRAFEDMSPIDDPAIGDSYLIPLNMKIQGDDEIDTEFEEEE